MRLISFFFHFHLLNSSFSTSYLLDSYCSSFLTGLLPFSFYYPICSTHYSTIKLSEEIIITLNTKTFAHKIKAKSCFYPAPASYSICLILEHVNCTLLKLPRFLPSSSQMCCDLLLSLVLFYQNTTHPVICMITLKKGTHALLHSLSSWWVPFTWHYFIGLFNKIVNFWREGTISFIKLWFTKHSLMPPIYRVIQGDKLKCWWKKQLQGIPWSFRDKQRI